MTSSYSSSSSLVSLLLISSLLLCSSSSSSSHEGQNYPPLAKGLSWNFYKWSCPGVEGIVRKELKKVFKQDIGLAAAMLRLHFHDCFVQGCDGSVLLDGSASGPSEQQAPPNLSLRPQSFDIIDQLRERVHRECGQVVSCADITALAARDAVHLSGGPDYYVPLGRRDGLTFATREATLANLPPPSSNASAILAALAPKNLDATDVVALSGGHTIGISHCTSFTPRLYPSQDPTMERTFADRLKLTCPTLNTTNTTVMDFRSPNHFDNKYYVALLNRQGLFTSDQDLYSYGETRPIVESFAEDQELFFEKFVYSMTKMGQLSVLTGEQGEIRANCSARNTIAEDVMSTSYLKSKVDEGHVADEL